MYAIKIFELVNNCGCLYERRSSETNSIKSNHQKAVKGKLIHLEMFSQFNRAIWLFFFSFSFFAVDGLCVVSFGPPLFVGLQRTNNRERLDETFIIPK